MWAFLLTAAMVVFALVIWGIVKRTSPKTEKYVCDVCGERECLCRKEEKGQGDISVPKSRSRKREQ